MKSLPGQAEEPKDEAAPSGPKQDSGGLMPRLFGRRPRPPGPRQEPGGLVPCLPWPRCEDESAAFL